MLEAIGRYIKPILKKGHREGQRERAIFSKVSSSADESPPTLSIPTVISTEC